MIVELNKELKLIRKHLEPSLIRHRKYSIKSISTQTEQNE